jgi:hypothetical protein
MWQQQQKWSRFHPKLIIVHSKIDGLLSIESVDFGWSPYGVHGVREDFEGIMRTFEQIMRSPWGLVESTRSPWRPVGDCNIVTSRNLDVKLWIFYMIYDYNYAYNYAWFTDITPFSVISKLSLTYTASQIPVMVSPWLQIQTPPVWTCSNPWTITL